MFFCAAWLALTSFRITNRNNYIDFVLWSICLSQVTNQGVLSAKLGFKWLSLLLWWHISPLIFKKNSNEAQIQKSKNTRRYLENHRFWWYAQLLINVFDVFLGNISNYDWSNKLGQGNNRLRNFILNGQFKN